VNFKGWVPTRVYWNQREPMVDWMYLGEERLRDPFFDDGVQRKLESPFHCIFRRQTSMDALRQWHETSPGLTPAGFIFHMSRCGSTLACAALSALDGNLTLSEPWPLGVVLRAHLRFDGITEQMRADWLLWIVSALGQRGSDANRLFIKFDSWGIAELPLIQKVFPNTPWIFLYREPIEVLVSQSVQPATWATPGALHPAIVNIPQQEMLRMDQEEYCARALGRLCEFALFHMNRSRGGMLVNYAEMPAAIWSSIARHFGLALDDQDVERMKQAARYNAKRTKAPFENDSSDKREAASDHQRELAARWIEPMYRRLEAARERQAPADAVDSPTRFFSQPV